MKDNIIITIIVSVLVLAILACHNYSKGIGTSDSNNNNIQNNVLQQTVNTNNINQISTENNYNNYVATNAVPFTTAPPLTETTTVTFDTAIESNDLPTATTRQSILGNSNQTSTSTHKFNIINNPDEAITTGLNN